jgi:hypothetical protein
MGAGKAGPGDWAERVRVHAAAAAGTVSPVGQHILGTLLPPPATAEADASKEAVEC